MYAVKGEVFIPSSRYDIQQVNESESVRNVAFYKRAFYRQISPRSFPIVLLSAPLSDHLLRLLLLGELAT